MKRFGVVLGLVAALTIVGFARGDDVCVDTCVWGVRTVISKGLAGLPVTVQPHHTFNILIDTSPFTVLPGKRLRIFNVTLNVLTTAQDQEMQVNGALAVGGGGPGDFPDGQFGLAQSQGFATGGVGYNLSKTGEEILRIDSPVSGVTQFHFTGAADVFNNSTSPRNITQAYVVAYYAVN